MRSHSSMADRLCRRVERGLMRKAEQGLVNWLMGHTSDVITDCARLPETTPIASGQPRLLRRTDRSPRCLW